MLAIFRKMCYTASEGISNPLTIIQVGIGNSTFFARGLPIPFDPLPEGIEYPLKQLARVLDNL